MILVFLVQLFFYLIFKSRYARVLKAQSEYEQAAASLAMNTRQARNISFFISSAFAGLAGSIYAYYINYIDPSSFSLHEMVFILTIVVVGSPGSFWGVIGGTIFLVLLPEPLRFTGEVQGWLEALFGLAENASLSVPVLNWVVAFFNYISSASVLGPMRQLLFALILFLVVYLKRESLFPMRREI